MKYEERTKGVVEKETTEAKITRKHVKCDVNDCYAFDVSESIAS